MYGHRLVELLPAALGIRNGDVKLIKNAGGTITNPFDSTMRSLLVAVYELGVNEVMIIGHTGCGVQGMDSQEMLHDARARNRRRTHIINASLRHRPRQLAARLRRDSGCSMRNCRPCAQSSADALRCKGCRLYHGLNNRRTYSPMTRHIFAH